MWGYCLNKLSKSEDNIPQCIKIDKSISTISSGLRHCVIVHGMYACNNTTHNTQHTAHSTQHTAHSTQHTAHSTQHTAQHTAFDLLV
jgi:hypothetical protein